MCRGEKFKGVMNTLLISWQHCSSECDSQTVWNTLDFETSECNYFSVIRISCPALYSLSSLQCCFDPAPHPTYWSSACSFSIPEERQKRGWRLWYFSCSFLFSSLMDRDISPTLLQRKCITAGLLCYNVQSGECTSVKQCVFRSTVGNEKRHQNHHELQCHH